MKSWIYGLAVSMVLVAAAMANAGSVTLSGSKVRVLDGDTVRITSEKKSIRLVGFNTGETSKRNAKCEAELVAGKRARTAFGSFCLPGR